MVTLLPRDSDNNLIPAVRLKPGGAQHIAVTSTAACNGTAFNTDTRVIGLYATGPVYLAFGDSTVVATTSDHYFPSGIYYDFAIGGGPVKQFGYVSALAVSSNCTLYISEKE